MLTTKELRFFSMARDQAKTSQAGGGIPIGSVLVSGDRVLGVGHNRRLQDSDPTSHAEIQCLRNAQLRPIYHDTVLYSTLMPCYMCAGAIVQFGIPRVIVGEAVNFKGAQDFLQAHGVWLFVLNDESSIGMLTRYISEHQMEWKGDIGQ